jgi:hypothetical protein
MVAWEPITPPQTIMLAWPWNAVAEQNVLIDLTELLLKTMEEEYRGASGNFDNYLTGFADDNNNMDLNCSHDIQAPCCKKYTVAFSWWIVATAAMVARQQTTSTVILWVWTSTLAWLTRNETIFNCMLIIYHLCTSTSTPSLQSFFCSSALVVVPSEVLFCALSFIPKMNRETKPPESFKDSIKHKMLPNG